MILEVDTKEQNIPMNDIPLEIIEFMDYHNFCLIMKAQRTLSTSARVIEISLNAVEAGLNWSKSINNLHRILLGSLISVMASRHR